MAGGKEMMLESRKNVVFECRQNMGDGRSWRGEGIVCIHWCLSATGPYILYRPFCLLDTPVAISLAHTSYIALAINYTCIVQL